MKMILLTLLLVAPSIKALIFDVKAYGAVGDGTTDDTAAIYKALAAATSSQGPSTVLFPEGHTFLSGPVNMTSGMTLQVEGTLKAKSGNNTADGEKFIHEGWPQIGPLPSYGNSRDGPYLQYQAFIYALNANDISIAGSGTIDGQGDWWWFAFNSRNHSVATSGRPNLVQLVNCSRVEVTGVTLRDSPFWCLHPVYCTDVHVHHMKVRSRMYAPNSDGIDPDSCVNVMIEHNDVSCGDDHIAIKAGVCGTDGGGKATPLDCRDPAFTSGAYVTRNVTVRYNTFRIGMGISVGSESSGGIKDVNIYDNAVGVCDKGSCLDTCCGWGPGLHLKTALTRGAFIENIMFRNNTIYNSSGFVDMETNYQAGDSPPTDYPATIVRNISFIGNHALGGGGALWKCSVNDACQGLTVINNTVASTGNPWGCHFIKSYAVSGNSPSGLEECMAKSMNKTGSVARKGRQEQKQEAIRAWESSREGAL